MAVYKIENGELALVAETLESMLTPELANWEDWDDLMRNLSFSLYDEVSGAYRFYRRYDSEKDSPDVNLPGVAYMFDVNIDESNMDYILVSSRLPEYLQALKLLEPLVNRAEAVERELDKARQKERTRARV
jgi:hypothetical protein